MMCIALSARALLLLAVVGGFIIAMREPSVLSLAGLGVYGLFIVGPVAFLEFWKRDHQ